MAFTRISGASARASDSVSVLTAPFDAAYATDEPSPAVPAMDDKFTTAPRPLAWSALRQARIIWNVPMRFTSYVRVNSLAESASRSACGMNRVVPAQLTNASTRPKCADIAAAAATQLLSCLTSSVMSNVRAPRLWHSRSTDSAS